MVELLEIKENLPIDVEFNSNMSILEELNKQGKYEEGIKQAVVFAEIYPEKVTEFYSWALEFCESTDNNNRLLDLLNQGLIKGAWWAPDFLRMAYEELFSKDKSFEQIIKLAEEKIPKEKVKAKLVVRTPTDYDSSKSYPLLLVLHGRGSNNKNSDKHWKSDGIRREMILGLLQSSQLISSVHCVWDNWDKAFIDIQAAYKTLKTNYKIDEEKSIIGGISAGAEVGIGAIFEDVIPIKKMISTITSTGKFTENYVNKKKEKKELKIYFIVGEKDVRHDNTTKIHQYLKKIGAKSELHTCVGIGHEIPRDFDKILEKALKFLYE
ncbi:MAG: hypothetical protein FK730_10255 [Asgard group archaeon]|nr:hypothetical protein [Asgard group archaeon]